MSILYDGIKTKSGIILTGSPPTVGYILGEDRGTIARIETKGKFYFLYRDFSSQVIFFVGAFERLNN